MSELLATAERLRTVKNAFREFIELWAIDALMEQHASSDRIAGDILRAAEAIDSSENIGTHNLSYLFHGRRLDD
jgi:hypothetical protein